ncbi:MAG: cytochrome c [Candidatus Caldarchaeum sp.]
MTKFRFRFFSHLGLISLAFLLAYFPLSGHAKESNINEELAAKGEKLFSERGCVGCHTIGKGKLVGPDLIGVTEIRDAEWLKKMIVSPDKMILTDPIAKELLKEYLVPMPNQGVTEEEAKALIEYLRRKGHENKKEKKS